MRAPAHPAPLSAPRVRVRVTRTGIVRQVMELLRVYLRGKHPLKTDSVVNEMVKKRAASGSLDEEEWVDIVRYMYTESDAGMLIVRVREAARLHRAALHSEQHAHGPQRGIARGGGGGGSPAAGARSMRLPYAAFIQVRAPVAPPPRDSGG